MADPSFYFTREHVSRLTGLSVQRLGYWARTGFYPRRREPDDGGDTLLYTFRELVGLRVLAKLRTEFRVPLQELRKVGDWLQERFETPWSSLAFFVETAKRRVYVQDPRTRHAMKGRDGQGVHAGIVPMMLEPIAREVRHEIAVLRTRPGGDVGRLAHRRSVAGGKNVIKGTRVTTDAVYAFHKAGVSLREILAAFPTLKRADVEAAIEFEKARHAAGPRRRSA